MKKQHLFSGLLVTISILFTQTSFAQLADGFDIKKAYQQAKDKGISKSDVEGYVQYLHNDYLSHKGGHGHLASKGLGVYDAGTIYLNGNNGSNPLAKPSNPNPNSPQNAYCPNAGFEQGTFANWTGGYGTVAMGPAGSGFPTYTQTSATIANAAGNNVGLTNTINYHTIMTTPATNSVYPNCVGWDSIACKVVGTQTVSEIPVVNPNGGPASVRLNGANANYRASKVTYNMALNPNNKNFSVSYALVLYSGGHSAEEQPYFSVKVTDQNGNFVPGCSVYTVTINSAMTNSTSPFYDPTWTESVVGWSPSDVYYRKWSTYAFDFSNYPAITSVNVEFYVGGCAQGGHWGYAYVDAECSQGGAVASFCANANQAVLTAPAGYSTYQWIGPSGPISVPNGGNAGTATISPVSAGQVFTCNVTAPNGCLSSFQTTVAISTVSITGVSSTPSCPNGMSGTANVSATGSSSGYNYQWVNSSGTTVGTTQAASGLAPGIYTVNVSAILCGLATTTVAVGLSPPSFYSLPAPYCGTVAWINGGNGSNYKWYTAAPLALIPGATTSSLTVNSPVNGAAYFLVYTTASGCKDSIRYVLTQSPGGSIYASNIKSICPGNNNSYAVINLQTAAPPVYSYTVTGPAGYNSVLNNTTAIKDSVVGLSIGTYSATVFDGQCLYNTTFTVSPFVYSYTLTPPVSAICAPGSTVLTVNFGNTTPSSCGLSTTGGCTTPNQITVGTGNNVNTNYSFPSVYGHYYRNARHQMLFTAAELLAAGVLPGKLSAASFMVMSIPAGYIGTLPGVIISLKCTPATQIGTVFDNVGLVQVYGGTNYTPIVGWNSHPFTTAYEWDGVNSLLVDICYSLNATAPYTTNPIQPSSTTPVPRCIYQQDDNNPLCGNAASWPTTTTERPNMKFDNCGGSNPAAFSYTWTPATGLSSTNTYTTIASPTVTTIYSVQVNPIGQTNCMQAQTATVNVTSAVTPTITPITALCTNASSFSLSATPAGGTWSLTAPTSTTGVFTPSLAAVGNNTVTYLYGGAGCSQTVTSTVPVEQYVPSTITGTLGPLCLPSSTINLSTAVTTSTLGAGVWSGAGVSGNTFDPSVAGSGTHTLTYNTNSTTTPSLCPSTSTIAVTLNTTATPTINAVNPLCTNASSLTLIVTPGGGTWTGTGVTPGGLFTPSLAIVGTNTYTYSVGASTCSAVNTITIAVEQYVPSTITGSVAALCITNPVVNLATALTTSTLGTGVWSGAGVTGTIFDPAVAGAGTTGTAVHTLTYSTNSTPTASLCPSASMISFTVNSIAQPTITPAGPYCDNYAAQTMTVTPTGGAWTAGTAGSSISGTGSFSPASSLVGNNTLLYTLTNGPCVNTETVSVTVVHFVSATILPIPVGPYCIYDAATNLQTIAQNAGGTWSGNGMLGSSFTPATAGAGIHTITYVTNPSPLLNCGSTETISILVNDKPEANAFPDVMQGCNPVTVLYQTTSYATGTALWDFGDGSPKDTGMQVSHTYTVPGTYTATLNYTDNIGCKDTTVANSGITVFALPIASFDPSVVETTVIDGQVEFINHSTVLDSNSYAWDIGGLYNSTNVDESYLFVNSGQFVVTLIATSADGCIDDTSVVINVNPDVVLYVPNAFTPGSDGLNDAFHIFLPPSGVDYSTFNLIIYDRWGELIYKTTDVTQAWTGAKNNSGEILKQDVYVYKITFKDEKKKSYEKIGHVSLLRK